MKEKIGFYIKLFKNQIFVTINCIICKQMDSVINEKLSQLNTLNTKLINENNHRNRRIEELIKTIEELRETIRKLEIQLLNAENLKQSGVIVGSTQEIEKKKKEKKEGDEGWDLLLKKKIVLKF